MKAANVIVEKIAAKTDRAILFHSASGKDSIALLDIMAPHFKSVLCVYMYVVKDLRHINRYVRWAERRYPNVRFVQIPHFALYSYKRTGYMGMKRDESARAVQLTDITKALRERYGIEWVFFGFKKSDSMNRRLMLTRYEEEAINELNKACYPLSSYKNSDVLGYIRSKGLPAPECYGKGQSSGTSVDDLNYLLFLRDRYPEDLKKVVDSFPLAERVLFEYDYVRNQAERNKAYLEESD